jgi:hypothetical protein
MDTPWPDETMPLPETPRVRLSPRRKLIQTPTGWPENIGDTIRMYHDSDEEHEDVGNFTMNTEFIQSKFH